MQNYFEYLKYYGNLSFSKVKLNELDMAIFSMLVYLPYVNIQNGITMEKFGEIVKSFDASSFEGAMTPMALELMDAVRSVKRYKDIKIYDFVKIDDDKLQFGAYTLRYGSNTLVIYEGTNTSIMGWLENLKLITTFPTLTQEYGINYLRDTIKRGDRNIYIGGHSKGGNLALSSAFLADDHIFKRIRKIYNFDGPGFRKDEYETDRFLEVNKKTTTFLPDGSIIGVILNNDKYRYVKANGVGFYKHYIVNWHTYGSFFLRCDVSNKTLDFKDKMEANITSLSRPQLDKAISILDEFFKANNITHTYHLTKIKFADLRKLLNNYKELDSASKEIILSTFKHLFIGKK